MDGKYCHQKCWRSGQQSNGIQRYYYRICRKYQQLIAGKRTKATLKELIDRQLRLNQNDIRVFKGYLPGIVVPIVVERAISRSCPGELADHMFVQGGKSGIT